MQGLRKCERLVQGWERVLAACLLVTFPIDSTLVLQVFRKAEDFLLFFCGCSSCPSFSRR